MDSGVVIKSLWDAGALGRESTVEEPRPGHRSPARHRRRCGPRRSARRLTRSVTGKTASALNNNIHQGTGRPHKGCVQPSLEGRFTVAGLISREAAAVAGTHAHPSGPTQTRCCWSCCRKERSGSQCRRSRRSRCCCHWRGRRCRSSCRGRLQGGGAGGSTQVHAACEQPAGHGGRGSCTQGCVGHGCYTHQPTAG